MLEAKEDDILSSEYTLSQLQSLPSMSWLPWAELLDHDSSSNSSDVSSTAVVVQHPAFIGKLHDFLEQNRYAILSLCNTNIGVILEVVN